MMPSFLTQATGENVGPHWGRNSKGKASVEVQKDNKFTLGNTEFRGLQVVQLKLFYRQLDITA